MRGVLFLTESFHPVLGGGERHIRALATSLAAAKMPATVVTRRTAEQWPSEEILDGIPIVRVRPTGPGAGKKYAMVPPAMAALARQRDNFDILVVRGTRVLGLPGLATARLLGKSVVLQPEVNGEFSGDVFTWGKAWAAGVAGRLVRAGAALPRRALLDADAFVAMSAAIAAEMRSFGIPVPRIHHIPHGVDVRRYHPADEAQKPALRRALGLEDRQWAIYTGRLLRGKGLETLVDAFALCLRAIPKAGLLLVGSGEGQTLSVEAGLRDRVRLAGLDLAVRFTGRVDNVEDYLRAADVFVFPSEFEALGLSLIEAAACGLPCIGSRTGGIVDVIEDGQSGVLVPPGEVDALAAALVAMLNDPATRKSYGSRGAALARERFDQRRVEARYRALFAEVASVGREGRGALASPVERS